MTTLDKLINLSIVLSAAVLMDAMLMLLMLLLLLSHRPDYMTTFCDKLINWDAVAKRYEAATA